MSNEVWKCHCGQENTGANPCTACGSPRPQASTSRQIPPPPPQMTAPPPQYQQYRPPQTPQYQPVQVPTEQPAQYEQPLPQYEQAQYQQAYYQQPYYQQPYYQQPYYQVPMQNEPAHIPYEEYLQRGIADISDRRVKKFVGSPLVLVLAILASLTVLLTLLDVIAPMFSNHHGSLVFTGIVTALATLPKSLIALTLSILTCIAFWRIWAGGNSKSAMKLGALKMLKGILTTVRILALILISVIGLFVVLLIGVPIIRNIVNGYGVSLFESILVLFLVA